jgi:outer membrane protein assembly factor BamB
MKVTTRSYNAARTAANLEETVFTPHNVGNNLMVKEFSLEVNDDPRIEAQPLYVQGVKMSDGKSHNVVYVCTMANNVWAFDANTGKAIWANPTHLGPPIQPKPTPVAGIPSRTDIDFWGINILWGILSTPVIDSETNRMYVVLWTSADGDSTKSSHELHEIDITNGNKLRTTPIDATSESQVAAGKPVVKFSSPRQKQRASLLLTTKTGGRAVKTVFVACGMTHEEGDATHGWLIAYDVGTLQRTAAWCTTPNGAGAGIWQAGQGPAADENGDIYVMAGNYGVEANNTTAPPSVGDLPESLVKLRYTPPSAGAATGKLEAVAWFTPFQDSLRQRHGVDNFQDYDLGSGGPVPLPGLNLVVGAGKDGVLYVLDTDDAKMGKGSDFAKLKQPPIFFTYFAGFGVDASQVANLDRLPDGKTHHLHGSPAFWVSPDHGPMLFVWGENESLRAWTIDGSGKVTFLAKSTEVASAGLGGKGGMPGAFLAVTSNQAKTNTGVVWSLAPLSGDANRHVVEGIVRAYDASVLDPVGNPDGTQRLKLLWDSKHIPNNSFKFSKFCPPVVADGKLFVATYEGRVDVYSLAAPPHSGPLPTNAQRMRRGHTVGGL